MWHELITYLTNGGLGTSDKFIRTFLTYAALLIGLRLAGKHELGQMSTFDLVLFLMLSSALETTIQGDDTSVVGGVFAFVMLLLFSKVLALVTYRKPFLRHLVEGEPVKIIRHGHLDQKRLDQELISPDELLAEARKVGIDRLDDIESFIIEVDGSPTIQRKRDSPELIALRQLGQRLDVIETYLHNTAGYRNEANDSTDTPTASSTSPEPPRLPESNRIDASRSETS